MPSAPDWIVFERFSDSGETSYTRVDLAFRDPAERDGNTQLATMKFSWPAAADGDDFDAQPEARAAEIALALDDALAEQADVLLAGETTRPTGSTVYLYFPADMPVGEVESLVQSVKTVSPFTFATKGDPGWDVFAGELNPTDDEELAARQVACYAPLFALEEDLSVEREVVMFFAFKSINERDKAHNAAMKDGRRTVPDENEYGRPMLGFVIQSDLEVETIKGLATELTKFVRPFGGRFELFDAEVFNAPDDEDEGDEEAGGEQR